MSRLIIKNLPENIKESRLRELFANNGGEITDLKLCFTKKGIFRKFAFIGYKSENEASLAVKTLNKTYIDTAKITVERCVNFGEETPTPRPWSKYSQGSSAFRQHTKEVEDRKKRINELQVQKKKGIKEKKKQETVGVTEKVDIKDDAKFQEFLSMHASKQNKKLWSNENTLNFDKETGEEKRNSNKKEVSSENDEPDISGSSDDEGQDTENIEESESPDISSEVLNDCVTIKMRGIPFKSKEVDIINFFKPLRVEDIRFAINKQGKRSGYAFVDFKNSHDMKKAMKKDKEEMKGRYIELFMSPHRENSTKSKKESQNECADVSETGRLFLRNLSYTCTETDLKDLFSTYGNLVEVHLPIDKNSNKSTGFAFVTFMMPEHALKAWLELDGKIFQGRILHIIPGRDKKSEKNDVDDSTYKKKKEADKKALSGSTHNWNALFLGQNAVAEVMAERLNKDKRDLLAGESQSSVAVHMALGETELVNETRTFLESYGVNLDVFGQANSARSTSIMLVKNLPPHTTKEELSDIFSKHGELGRLLMPPFGITAIIEFINATDAKKAFHSLAYSKFKHTPLYLEWAPVGVLSGEVTVTNDAEDDVDDEEDDGSEKSDDEESQGRVLFVKNLNFDTNEAKLKAIFSSCGKIKEATIAKKKDTKKDGNMLSMGYGFVKYKKVSDADKAIKNLQGCELDGHKLELKKSHRETTAPKSSRKRAVEKKQTSSKIVVRNIPFEANVKEVKDLFSSFGIIKSIRLPKKMAGTGSHRGFAFIDFVTKQEAKRAFKALCLSTHLYGRRLVLEWADDDESVDMLQQKTAQQYDQETEPSSKRRKQTMLSSLEGGGNEKDA